MKALLLGRGHTGVQGAMLDGFGLYGRPLKSKLGLSYERIDLPLAEENLPLIERLIATTEADAVFVMTSFREKPADIVAAFRRLYERPSRPKLIYLDYFAQTSSPYFDVLPYVDRYVKRQTLRDRSLYQKDYSGGFILTDYLERRLGLRLRGWHFGSRLPEKYADRLITGWSPAVTKQGRRMLQINRIFPKKWRNRRTEINARLSLGERDRDKEWYQQYRAICRDHLSALRGKFRISPFDRVPWRQFLFELRDSKIVFSPFGWGEVCFRDYEAIFFGSLLVKPSMEHVETRPDIYLPSAYVPCAWDNADLAEKCRYYLDHPDEAEAIIRRAQEIIVEYFDGDGFVKDVGRVIEGL